jgi:hypothetical protein
MVADVVWVAGGMVLLRVPEKCGNDHSPVWGSCLDPVVQRSLVLDLLMRRIAQDAFALFSPAEAQGMRGSGSSRFGRSLRRNLGADEAGKDEPKLTGVVSSPVG